ncbi:MAG: regulatory signaling modulator protein AmpE [Rhodocyclaceae bacterium]|nr:regulatory signaling modulator protein AmpE [Rhodocyclaceae bacterium]
MTLLLVIFALLLEQARPLDRGRVNLVLRSWANLLRNYRAEGEGMGGAIAWSLGVALPATFLLIFQGILVAGEAWLLGLLLGVVTLYLTMGFRQFSHFFTDIHQALGANDLSSARRILSDWVAPHDLSESTAEELVTISIETAFQSSHRHVFAPLFWFSLLGPAGALLYRLAAFFEAEGANPFARRAFVVIDWLPVRLTAIAFAVVGDFEEAVGCWRGAADDHILRAAGMGALGAKEEMDVNLMQRTVGLVWRTLVLALLLLAIIGVSGWLGVSP